MHKQQTDIRKKKQVKILKGLPRKFFKNSHNNKSNDCRDLIFVSVVMFFLLYNQRQGVKDSQDI